MGDRFSTEDFEVADLATKGRFDVARRTDPSLARQWHVYGSRQGCFSDEEMAADGWEPVVESRITEGTLLDTKETHERVIAELRHDLKVALAVAADLGDENDRLERILQAPLSLKDLGVAWVAAEEADECREGDVLIIRDDEDNYLVRRMDDRSDLDSAARILSRAPREPWVELAGVLHDVINQGGDDRIDVDSVAARLYAEGVRVTRGGNDE